MELKDTIDMMTSDDYRERFKAEYWQLVIRMEKLAQMLDALEAGTLDFELTYPRRLLYGHYNTMLDYRSVLKERARKEGIDLYEGVAHGEE